jgi:hypothetical protein
MSTKTFASAKIPTLSAGLPAAPPTLPTLRTREALSMTAALGAQGSKMWAGPTTSSMFQSAAPAFFSTAAPYLRGDPRF